MKEGQHHMTRDERQKLEALRNAKVPVAQIAKQLGFCRQTIYNELERGAYILLGRGALLGGQGAADTR